jgi:hypothetical protein
MTLDQMPAPQLTERYDRSDPAERVVAAFVRDAFETDLRARVDSALDRQLAVFLAIQSVPSRTFRQAA